MTICRDQRPGGRHPFLGRLAAQAGRDAYGPAGESRSCLGRGADGPVSSRAREQAMGRFAGRASCTVKNVLKILLFFRSILTDMLMNLIRICSLFNIAPTCIFFLEN